MRDQSPSKRSSLQRSHRHHYLPQFMLREWVSATDDMLWRYQRVPSGKLHEKHVFTKEVGFRTGLYWAIDPVKVRTGGDDDSIEREFFSKLDTEASKAHDSLLRKGPEALTDDERRSWAMFLNSLTERDPVTLTANDRSAASVAEGVAERMRSMIGSERFRLFEHTVDPIKRYVVRNNMVERIADKRTLDYLSAQRWTVVSSANFEFLLSDLPLVVNGEGARAYPIRTLALAISPSKIFISMPAAWDVDKTLLSNTAIAYNISMMTGEGTHLYSRDRLSDTPVMKTRTYAESHFGRPKVP